jgi:hypothetical protein
MDASEVGALPADMARSLDLARSILDALLCRLQLPLA